VLINFAFDPFIEFILNAPYLKQFEIKILGLGFHAEFWISSEDLEGFNGDINGKHRVNSGIYSDIVFFFW